VPAPHQPFHSPRIALDNLAIQMKAREITSEEPVEMNMFQSFSDVLLFSCIRLGRAGQWFEAMLVQLQIVAGQIINKLAGQYTERLVSKILSDEDLGVRLIQSLNALISTDSTLQWSPPSEEEKRLRSDLLYRCIEALVEERIPRLVIFLLGGQREVRTVVRNILDVFQLPRLNKQLMFVLMDRIMHKLAADVDDRV